MIFWSSWNIDQMRGKDGTNIYFQERVVLLLRISRNWQLHQIFLVPCLIEVEILIIESFKDTEILNILCMLAELLSSFLNNSLIIGFAYILSETGIMSQLNLCTARFMSVPLHLKIFYPRIEDPTSISPIFLVFVMP